MNKTIILGGLGVLLLVGGGLYLKNTQDQNNTALPQSENSFMKGAEPTTTDVQGNSRYVEFSPAALAGSANTRRVLYFYASWCPTCRPADADFTARADKIPSDVIVIRVNYNDTDTDAEEKALAKKYAITYQHTFVQIDEKGEQVAVWNGGKTAELLENLK